VLEWLADPMWQKIQPSAEVVGGFAAGVGLLVGGMSLLLILLQTRHAAYVSRQVAAIDAHKEYIRLCIQHPDLSSSLMMKQVLRGRAFDNILSELSVDSERALWFLSYVLFAMEQLVLTNVRRGKVDSAWQSSVEDQLRYHVDLLRVVWPEWRSHYSDGMNKIVQTVLAENALRGS
jgi:hypothetical protein